MFLTSTASLMAKSALFVAWGQLVTYDLSLTRDNASEPFDVPCNAAADDGTTDIWCPLGAASDDISFFRSSSCSVLKDNNQIKDGTSAHKRLDSVGSKRCSIQH